MKRQAAAEAVRECGFVPAAQAAELAGERGKSAEDLLLDFLETASGFAEPPISRFRVGAVALGKSGNLYLGANIEFLGEALTFDIHAEQAAAVNAWTHGEKGLSAIAVTAAPCGHCRQFLNELPGASSIRCLLPGRPARLLSELLPDSFGPKDLGVSSALMEAQDHRLSLASPAPDPLVAAALAAANMSYAPYTRAFSGVALSTARGRIFPGPYAENAAFNPSLPPLESALVGLRICGGRYEEIRRAVLVESEGAATSQVCATRAVLESIAPSVRLEVHLARGK
jgi:cytidine deaminase